MKLKIEKEIPDILAFGVVFCLALAIGFLIGMTITKDAVRNEVRGELGNLTTQTFVYGADYGASFVLGRMDKINGKAFDQAGLNHRGYLDGYYNDSLQIPIIGE